MRRLAALCGLGLLLVSSPAPALRSDRDQPVLLDADQATLSERRGVSVYRGHVVVRQGTLRITGDVLTLYGHGGHIERAVVEGRPATFRQRPDGKPEDVRARARRMVYEAARRRVILTGEAVVWQGGDVFRSARIVYDIDQDRVQAGGTAKGSASPGDGRVHILLQPPAPHPPAQARPPAGKP
ncbi:MAG: lipopolysaccharide transport periplasmic protein LptA [Gammaproteobacteria bacterium]|nr:MAG: lipopolysaccharide transport periplasmic protein LptA [Gammaproteobacteria bacterium]